MLNHEQQVMGEFHPLHVRITDGPISVPRALRPV